MAWACEGVQRSVGPRELIWESREEGEMTWGGGAAVEMGGFRACCPAGREVGGDGVPVWEAEGLGEGSSIFTVEILPATHTQSIVVLSLRGGFTY